MVAEWVFGITLKSTKEISVTRATTVVKASIEKVNMRNTSARMKEGATCASNVIKFSELTLY